MKISNHIVQNHSETVSVNCSTNGEQLYSADVNSTISHVEMPYKVIVKSSANQGKYVCINEQNRLAEIHYISIKGNSISVYICYTPNTQCMYSMVDYQPPEFLYPPSADSITRIHSLGSTVPTCAVYSSLPATEFTHILYLDESSFPFYMEERRPSGLYFKIILKSIPATSQICNLTTEWDSISLKYRLHYPPGITIL